MPDSRGYPTYFERFPTRAAYEDCKNLIALYGAKFPRLRAQWEARMRQYELGRDLL